MKVLLVEDVPADAIILLQALQRNKTERYDITRAGHVSEALACLQHEHFEVMLLDVSLPDGAWRATLEQMHSAAPHIPIVVLTATDDEETGLAAIRLHAQDYIVKDDRNISQIARTIRHAIERKRADEALRESNERLWLAVRAAELGVFEWNVAADCAVWQNPRMFEMFGRRPEDGAINKAMMIERIVHPEDTAVFETSIDAALRSDQHYHAVFRIRRCNDGEVRWLETNGYVERAADHAPVRLIAVAQDITARKHAEERLAYLASFPEYNPNPIAEVTIATNTLEYANPMAQHLYPDLIARGTAHPWLAGIELAVATLRGQQQSHCRHEMLVGDRWFDQYFSLAFGGQRIRMYGRDITERKRTEEALRRSEALYRAIGESIEFGVWVCAPDGRNIYASDSFLKLVGLTQEQCSNFGWGDVLHPDDAARTIAAWKECVRTGGMWDIEHRFRGVDGQYHAVLARGVPVKDARGAITCWAGINLDISRLKNAEERIEAALREKSVLLQELYHRTKNTMHLIVSILNLQMLKLSDPLAVQALKDTQHRIMSMALVHEKLYNSENLSQIELNDYLTSLVTLLVKGYQADGTPVMIDADIDRVMLSIDAAIPCGLMINELVSNAMKHAFPGRRDKTIRLRARVCSNGDVDLVVADNGVGLPRDFDFRTSSSLGLQAVVALAEHQLGGRIEVLPPPGTAFRVVFHPRTS